MKRGMASENDANIKPRKRARRDVAETPAVVGMSLLDVLPEDMLAVIARTGECTAADHRALAQDIDASGQYPHKSDMNLLALRFPIARQMAMCCRTLRDLVVRRVPEVISLIGHPYPSSIHMAWYAIMAGSRTLSTHNFIKGPAKFLDPWTKEFVEGMNIIGLCHARDMGRRRSIFDRGGETPEVRTLCLDHVCLRGAVTAMEAAAIYFRHDANARLFFDTDMEMTRVRRGNQNKSTTLRGYMLMRRRAKLLTKGIHCDDYCTVVRLARSVDELERVFRSTSHRTKRCFSDHWNSMWLSACCNGALDVMQYVWARKPDNQNDAAFALDVWDRMCASPRGADSWAAHAWLYERVPFTPRTDGRDRLLLTATSIRFFATKWTSLSPVLRGCGDDAESLLAIVETLVKEGNIRTAPGPLLRLKDPRGRMPASRFFVAQMTPAERDALFALLPPDVCKFGTYIGVWLTRSLHMATHVPGLARRLIDLLYMTDIDALGEAIATRYCEEVPFEPVLRCLFDALIDRAGSPAAATQAARETVRRMGGRGTISGEDTHNVMWTAIDYCRERLLW